MPLPNHMGPMRSKRAISRRTVLQGAAAAGLAGAGLQFPGLSPKNVALARQADQTTLIVGLDGAPSDRDPHSQYDYRSTVIIRSVYEGLIGYKGAATDEYEGLVAESWESNDDLSVWTFKLRPGLTFHNGDPCDSAAVKASYERLIAMGKGASGVVSRFVSDPAQMETPDPATIVFNLNGPQPLFPAAMAATYGPQIVNVKVTQANEEDGDFGNAWLQINSEGAGTGAWIVTEADQASGFILDRNPTYWAGWEGEHLDRVIVRIVPEAQTMRQLVEAGDVDIMDTASVVVESIAELSQNPDLVVDSSDSTEVEYFTMTVGGPLATPEARQALAYAFPYQDVIDGVYVGNASRANTLVAPSVLGFDKGSFFFETDMAKAKELLTAAGVAEGTELTSMVQEGATTAPQELFQAALAELGITMTLETVDQPTATATFYGDAPVEDRPNLMRWSWWPDYNDAWNALYPTTSCDSWGSKGANGGFYCNEEFEKLLADSKDASTLETYNEVLAKAQAIIAEQDPPWVVVSQPKWNTVLNKRVQGFVFNAINLGTYDFYKMSKTA